MDCNGCASGTSIPSLLSACRISDPPPPNTHTPHNRPQTRRRVVSPAYMDRLLMNFLVVEGHKEAAAALAEESGVARE